MTAGVAVGGIAARCMTTLGGALVAEAQGFGECGSGPRRARGGVEGGDGGYVMGVLE